MAQRSGFHTPASGPQMSSRKCITAAWQNTICPADTRIGDFPSFPPPTGSVVSLLAFLMTVGTMVLTRSAAVAS